MFVVCVRRVPGHRISGADSTNRRAGEVKLPEHVTSSRSDDQARVHAEGLRRVAVASVAALAVVLPLAVATAGSGHGEHHGNAGHSATHSRAAADAGSSDD
jgi:hypothetical protein